MKIVLRLFGFVAVVLFTMLFVPPVAYPCSNGYVEVSGTYCSANQVWTHTLRSDPFNSVVCARTPALVGVTDAKAVLVVFTFTIYGTESVGTHESGVLTFQPADTTCSLARVNSNYGTFREYAPTPYVVQLGTPQTTTLLLSDSGGSFYYKSSRGNSNPRTRLNMQVLGYFK